MEQPPVSITQIPADFGRWGDVLALIMHAFAFMDGIIDPPSSAHLLTVEALRAKALRETGFLALDGDRIVGCVFALERPRVFMSASSPSPRTGRGKALAGG